MRNNPHVSGGKRIKGTQCRNPQASEGKRKERGWKMTVMYVILIAAAAAAVLYLLAIKPRLGRQKGWEPFRGVYYAHRGLHDNGSGAPENSLPAFKRR